MRLQVSCFALDRTLAWFFGLLRRHWLWSGLSVYSPMFEQLSIWLGISSFAAMALSVQLTDSSWCLLAAAFSWLLRSSAFLIWRVISVFGLMGSTGCSLSSSLLSRCWWDCHLSDNCWEPFPLRFRRFRSVPLLWLELCWEHMPEQARRQSSTRRDWQVNSQIELLYHRVPW